MILFCHLEVINGSYMHSAPKSEHNRTTWESSSYSSLGLLNLTLGRECQHALFTYTYPTLFRVRLHVQSFFLPMTMSLSSLSIIFTVCTQTQRNTSRWWSCRKRLKECRYWKCVEYKSIALLLSLPRLNLQFVKAVSNHKLEVWNTYKATYQPDFIVKIFTWEFFSPLLSKGIWKW